MSIYELGIKRYVMTIMTSVVVIVSGIFAFTQLAIDEQPNVDFPFITITTLLRGADAKTIDNTVSLELLDKVGSLSGVKTISATSVAGRSSIFIEFELEKDIDVAFNETQVKVNEALVNLPSDVETPLVSKVSSTGDPVLYISLAGNRTVLQLNQYVDDIVSSKIENISGVGSLDVFGQRDKELKISLDTSKLSSYGIKVSELIQAINRSHSQLSGGYIVGSLNEYLLNLDLENKTVSDFENIIVRNQNNSLVRLQDVADVYVGLGDFRSFSFYNSVPSLTMGVYKISGSNVFNIEQEVIKRLKEDLVPNLDPGMNLEIVRSNVDYIRAMVALLEEHLVLGTIFTAFVVFLFLRSIRSTLIVAYSIPVSLCGAIFVIYISGYTLNSITLLGLLLLIGVVVDDTIIILENIYSKIEKGMEPAKASIEGTKEIVFAVMAATLSLLAIFGPVIFMPGIVGRFFISFAVVVSCGVIISYIVAVYITPMMCARYLKVPDASANKGIVYRTLESVFLSIENFYLKILKVSLNFSWLFVLMGLAFFLSSFYFFGKVGGEFTPPGDRSSFRINVVAPVGSNIYYTISKVKEVEDILSEEKEIKSYISRGLSSSVNRGIIVVNMVDISEREISQSDYVKKLQRKLSGMQGARVMVSESTGFGSAQLEFSLVSTGTKTLNEMYDVSKKMEESIRAIPEVISVDADIDLLPQASFVVDKDKAALLNLTVSEINQVIAASVGGININKYSEEKDSKRYDVRLQSKEGNFSDINSLNNIFLGLGNQQSVRLDSVATPYPYLGFSKIQREFSLYKVPFSVNTNVSTSDAVALINDYMDKNISADYKVIYSGAAEALGESLIAMAVVFAFSIFLLYVVLASQFNKFIQPLILLASIPLAITGAVVALYLGNSSLNIFSMIGLVLLIGLVVKNAILLIEYSNDQRREGKGIKEALLVACPRRLRPILMTSLTVIITMIPAVMSEGTGSENGSSLALSVIGGMVSSTILTLIVIPSLYLIVETFLEKKEKKSVLIK